MRWPAIAAFGLLFGCAPNDVRLSLDSAYPSAILVFSDPKGVPTEIEAIDFDHFEGLPTRTLADEGDTFTLYVAYFDRALAAVGWPAGKISLALAEDVSRPFPKPDAVGVATIGPTSKRRLTLESIPALPEAIAALELKTVCPPDGPLAPPVDLPRRCRLPVPDRSDLCYGDFVPFSLVDLGAIEAPGDEIIEDGARWLYLTSTRLHPFGRPAKIRIDANGADPTSFQDVQLVLPTDRGDLNDPQIRADGRELFLSSTFPARTTDTRRLFLAKRASDRDPFEPMVEITSITEELHLGHLEMPVLLADYRTVLFAEEGRPGFRYARRTSTTAGDLGFGDFGFWDTDKVPGIRSLTLTCDGGHVMYAAKDDAIGLFELRTAAIRGFEPFELSPSAQVPTGPFAPRDPDSLRLVEAVDCSALYATFDGQSWIARRTDCP